jgi:hypothetical protein
LSWASLFMASFLLSNTSVYTIVHGLPVFENPLDLLLCFESLSSTLEAYPI